MSLASIYTGGPKNPYLPLLLINKLKKVTKNSIKRCTIFSRHPVVLKVQKSFLLNQMYKGRI